MPRRLFRALLAVGPATVGVVAALVVVASLVTCSHYCRSAAAVADAFIDECRALLAARDAR
jgi:hypothetical protein